MSVSNVNGKLLRRNQYHILKDLGIEIILYELQVIQDSTRTWYAFDIKGSLEPEFDFDETHELLTLMKAAKDSESPMVEDALNQLRMAVELSKNERS